MVTCTRHDRAPRRQPNARDGWQWQCGFSADRAWINNYGQRRVIAPRIIHLVSRRSQ
jgi:hypothetical protein